MDRNRWLIFAVICVGIVAGLVLLPGKNKIDVSSRDVFKVDTTSEIKDHVYGKADSTIMIYEFADYQCPGCTAAYPQIKAISDQYKDSVGFVYRNFPLTSGHAHAFAAAATAEAAGLQGKFREMHNELYSTRDTWAGMTADERNKAFEGYAAQLGLNLDQFRSDLASEKVANKVNTDRALGIKAGVDSTPTIFLNGTKLDKDTVNNVMKENGDALRDKLDELIKKAGGTPPARTAATTTTAQ